MVGIQIKQKYERHPASRPSIGPYSSHSLVQCGVVFPQGGWAPKKDRLKWGDITITPYKWSKINVVSLGKLGLSNYKQDGPIPAISRVIKLKFSFKRVK